MDVLSPLSTFVSSPKVIIFVLFPVSAVVDFHLTRNGRRPDTAGAHAALSFGHTDETKRTAERHRRTCGKLIPCFPNNIAQWGKRTL